MHAQKEAGGGGGGGGFTSISLPMIPINRIHLLKFKITNKMLETWTCINPAGTRADCTFNVFSFFNIVSKEDARVRSYLATNGTSNADRIRMLFERFDWNDIFKHTDQVYEDVPKDRDNFSILMNKLAEIIRPGYGAPIGAQCSASIGHSFILAVTNEGEICVIDPQTEEVYRGMIGVHHYFNKNKFIRFGLYYEGEKESRHRTHMFEAEIRKQKKLDPPLKKQQLKMPSDRGVVSPGLVVLSDRGVSPGLVVSPGQKRVVKMKKKAKKTAKLIRDMKKEVKGNKLARTLKKAKIVKLKEELSFLKKGKGKSRKLGFKEFGKFSRRRK